MAELPSEVRIREVGPRDGFQNEPEVIGTADKVRLIDQLARTGLRRLEVTSFVRPDVIPQLADAAEVLEAIDPPEGVSLSVLIPNERGLDGALEHRARVHEGHCFLAESGVDSFESSFGELGGCPVPPGATGNIATEDLVSMLHEMGVETGVSLERLVAAARAVQEVLGRPLGSHVLTAGPVRWQPS